ncbi:MBL fold metallo-hydrolase [uncultured Prevotella sp.]|uniref:MBL fold metallo-hydrolase n=1 Tax=uncultured Prevotella sp. TaxID=159272 RepID=UPI0025D6A396|nr:MBL fold metallo-hydrolase [uncultured Prevotella sp.]
MTITILGTGTSCGVPVVGCQCDVCQSTHPKDKRLRCSILVETEQTRLLIDAGPDFRQQMLTQPFRRIDGILVTHSHYDHVGGMDDIRPYCQFGKMEVYADAIARQGMLEMLPYCFAENRYPGVPQIGLNEIRAGEAFTIGDIEVLPVQVMHGKLPILGYRFGTFAYITDMKSIDPEQVKLLRGVETLMVNALRFDRPHHSHQLVDDAIAFARQVGARRTLLTHMCHDIGLHDEVNRRLPSGFELAFDGQVLEI